MYNQTSAVTKPRPKYKSRESHINVTIDPPLATWGKRQPEGLSGLIRQLLRAEFVRREGPSQLSLLDAPGPPAQPAETAARPPAATGRR